eukprot:3456051-Alexandrium_andersonii.AAC.1
MQSKFPFRDDIKQLLNASLGGAAAPLGPPRLAPPAHEWPLRGVAPRAPEAPAGVVRGAKASQRGRSRRRRQPGGVRVGGGPPERLQ